MMLYTNYQSSSLCFFSDTNILFHVFFIKAQCVVLAPVALFEKTWKVNLVMLHTTYQVSRKD